MQGPAPFNPAGLVPFGPPPPRPEPGNGQFHSTPQQTKCRAQAVQMAGGPLNNILSSPDITPFEQLFRRLPNQGIHSAAVSQTNPYVLECGSFIVPDQQALVLFDFRPDIYRFSGLDPNDAMPFEARRFASQIGWDLRVSGNRSANLKMELEPIARQTGIAFQPKRDAIESPGFLPTAAAYAQARANSFGDAAGAGTGLLPQRHERYGAPALPLSLILSEKQTVDFRAVVFKAVSTPIAFFEMDMAGILVPSNMLAELVQCFKWRQ